MKKPVILHGLQQQKYDLNTLLTNVMSLRFKYDDWFIISSG